MPVVNFYITWPDQIEAKCYSPSSVITAHLSEGASYPLDEFMQRTREGLHQASERVRAKYGYACSAAADQLEIIERDAKRYENTQNAVVKVVKFSSSENNIY